MCQTEVTTKNIEFSFLINRLMVKYNVYGSRIGTLMWRINDEAEGRIVNATINGGTLELDLLVQPLYVIYDNDVTCHIARVTV